MSAAAILDRLPADLAEAIAERAAILATEEGLEPEAATRRALELAGIVRDPLAHFLAHGVAVAAAYDSGAYIAKGEDFRQAFTKDRATVSALWNGQGDAAGRAKGTQIRRFRFEPGPAGILALDLDRGHENEADGIRNFYYRLLLEGIVLPPYLADIEGGSFPAYTMTPSGGLHLYFRYMGGSRYGHQAIAKDPKAPREKGKPIQDGIEAFHFGNLLTVPGSWKADRPYIFRGDLAEAPFLPGFLERMLEPSGESRPRPAPRPDFRDRPRERPTLDRIAEWAIQDGNFEGRNRLCFEVARRASRPEYHYTAEEVAAFLRHFGPVDGLPESEILTAARSAFKGAR